MAHARIGVVDQDDVSGREAAIEFLQHALHHDHEDADLERCGAFTDDPALGITNRGGEITDLNHR
jgi:hypothetical protein